MFVIQCPHCSLEVELDGTTGLFDCPHCGEEFEWAPSTWERVTGLAGLLILIVSYVLLKWDRYCRWGC